MITSLSLGEGATTCAGDSRSSDLRLVFVVGMPRSGTKLLRDLLNGHRDVAIFPNESHFIPYFQKRYGARTDLNNRLVFQELFCEVAATTFGRRLAARGIILSEEHWRNGMKGGTYADFLDALFLTYRTMTGCSVVGDKTPEYLTQIPILSELFPGARFIHIVRDPRDYALSMRNAWNKNMARAVQRWKTHIRKYIKDVNARSIAEVTVRYEELLAAPDLVLSRICEYLGIPFVPAMMTIRESSEELGDARGMQSVKSDNSQKWMTRMSPAELLELERIAGALMVEIGYEPACIAGDEDLGAGQELIFRAADAASLFRFRLRTEGGLLPALGETWRAYRHSGIDE